MIYILFMKILKFCFFKDFNFEIFSIKVNLHTQLYSNSRPLDNMHY